MDTQTPFTDITAGANPQQQTDTSAFTDSSHLDPQTTQNAFTDAQPTDVQKGEQYVGSEDFENLCQVFFQQMTGLPVSGQNAINSFYQYEQEGMGHQGLQGVQPGDGIYFQDPNQPNGHVAIVSNILPNGDVNIISPDYTGVHMHKLSDWVNNTGQSPVGYVRAN